MRDAAQALLDPPLNRNKAELAERLDRAGLLELLLRRQWRRLGPHVRCVNYHHVPPARAESFERQLRWFAEHFVAVGAKELDDLAHGHWPHEKPGILLSFDDGCRTHAEVVAPLLERHGFTGWFFVLTGFCDTPESEQRAWAWEHAVSAWAEPGEARLALRWDQVCQLALRHVVGAHTKSHARLAAELGRERLRDEVIGSKQRLEQVIGQPVPAFAWVGGEEWSYSAAAHQAIAEAGFRFAFGTNNLPYLPRQNPLRIERTNLEAGYSLALVRFQLSGLMDLLYARKRRRLAERLTLDSREPAASPTHP